MNIPQNALEYVAVEYHGESYWMETPYGFEPSEPMPVRVLVTMIVGIIYETPLN